jgi:predicted DNA-binding transcriptional regulator AlpA
MKEPVKEGKIPTPMLFPIEPEQFWQAIRQVIREEISHAERQPPSTPPIQEHPNQQPPTLYKIADVCKLFRVTKPTVYDWIRHGKLKPLKIQSRVFFLSKDVQQLLTFTGDEPASIH